MSQGLDAAGTALSRTYDELAHNEELHKGVEFGFKAAGEVSKDVWQRAGEDAAGAIVGATTSSALGPILGTDPVKSILRNRGWRMANDGYDLYDESRRDIFDLEQRIRSKLPKGAE